jgi:hypothetical protein
VFAAFDVIHRRCLNRFDFLFGEEVTGVTHDCSGSAFLASADY